jgi:hypothetical protein
MNVPARLRGLCFRVQLDRLTVTRFETRLEGTFWLQNLLTGVYAHGTRLAGRRGCSTPSKVSILLQFYSSLAASYVMECNSVKCPPDIVDFNANSERTQRSTDEALTGSTLAHKEDRGLSSSGSVTLPR